MHARVSYNKTMSTKCCLSSKVRNTEKRDRCSCTRRLADGPVKLLQILAILPASTANGERSGGTILENIG